MIQTKVRISLGDIDNEVGHIPLIPITIPEMTEIRALAWAAHEKGEHYTDEVLGWPVSYEPELATPVPHSTLQVKPAVFTIGCYPIWFVSLTWEQGKDQEPSLWIEDEHLVTPAVATPDARNGAVAHHR
jgi:hypothetical protein